jgi:hypothetical protein
VDRTDDDYTRLVSLNAPHKRPDMRGGDHQQYSQRRVDVIDVQSNRMATLEFSQVSGHLPPTLVELFADRDEEAYAASRARGFDGSGTSNLTFEQLFTRTGFVEDLREILCALQEAYDYPVDIEFTANFLPDGNYRINLLQCRPFQVKIRGEGSRVRFPVSVKRDDVLLETRGPIIGHSLASEVHRIIYVVPAVYSQMSMSQRYSVARTIGRLTHLEDGGEKPVILLVGPGRWGTSMPSLGVPVSFAEINTVSVICEMAIMHEGLVPDISLGTHFFNDLVEMDMLYLAVTPGKEGQTVNEDLIRKYPNQLAQLLPSAAPLAEVILVCDVKQLPEKPLIYLNVDSMKQKALCYVER